MFVFNSSRQFDMYFLDKSFSIGIVPTMGALHDGHLSLIKKALSENDKVLVTIFVNPTQFDDILDLKSYPTELEKDLDKISQFGENVLVFAPDKSDIYGDKIHAKQYDLLGLDNIMEGKIRKGHFQGVATVVEYFLKTFSPNKAYFGEKDYQQLLIIKYLSESLNLPTKIVGCPIVRAKDGLAMSSRNLLLSPKERKIAPEVYMGLKLAKKLAQKEKYKKIQTEVGAFFQNLSLIKLEYFIATDPFTLVEFKPNETIKSGRGFIAATLGKIRLIDNINLS
jgi:pantoate--beta-alanine ligase